MNIFVLDENPEIAAEMQCDKHVVKMIIESAQMLSSAHRYLDGDEFISISKNGRKIKRWCHWTDDGNPISPKLYKSIMINHPCTIWTYKTKTNYFWHAEHAMTLCYEYTHRYGKTHASEEVIDWCYRYAPNNIPDGPLTPFAQAMPDEYKHKNAVEAYHAYYRGEKARFAKWTKRNIPEWFLTKDKTMVQSA